MVVRAVSDHFHLVSLMMKLEIVTLGILHLRPVFVPAPTVTLAWQDDGNGLSAGTADDVYGQLFQHLAANFTAVPTSGQVSLQVVFTDTSTPAATADAWSWSFGDGGESAVQHPVYTYTAAGNYTVTLTITDTGTGETDTLVRGSFITVTQPAAGDLVATTISYACDDRYRPPVASRQSASNASQPRAARGP